MHKNLSDILTTQEVADFLKISQKSVYLLLHDGLIHHRRIGRIYRIPKSAVVEYLQNT